jgi:hypothetical protein
VKRPASISRLVAAEVATELAHQPLQGGAIIGIEVGRAYLAA